MVELLFFFSDTERFGLYIYNIIFKQKVWFYRTSSRRLGGLRGDWGYQWGWGPFLSLIPD